MRLLLGLLVLFALAAPASAATAENRLWTSYGRDNQLTNAVASATLIAKDAPRLGLAWRDQLEGAIIASPLAAPIAGRQLLFVATEAGQVYALDAANGAIVWQRSFKTVTTPSDACGSFGISSTGAIDNRAGRLYVVGAGGRVHALALATGEEAAGWPVRVIKRARNAYEYVWGGLRIGGGRLYVPVASYCDQPDPNGVLAEGRLLALPLDDPARIAAFDPVAGAANMGGVWGWGGVSIEPDGSFVYTAIGNSAVYSEACACLVDDAGYGDAVVKRAPDLSHVVAADRPAPIPGTGDYDFGAAPLLFRPKGCPPLAAANNKVGALFIWDRTRLAAGPRFTVSLSNGVSAFVGAPSWSARLQTIYEAQVHLERGGQTLGDGVEAFRFTTGCKLRPVWSAALGRGNQPTPLVAGELVVAGGGSTGGWFVRSASSGRALWSAATGAATIAAPISVGGAIVGGDTGGSLYAFRVAARRR